MPLTKITVLERLQLLAMYAAGFEKEAQDYALELKCTKHYAAVLHAKMLRQLKDPKRSHSEKWLRAKLIGKIEI